MKIFAFHLLNDYSGSPKVLSQLIRIWSQSNIPVTVVSCKGRQGFLSNIPHCNYLYFPYRWSKNPWLRLFYYFFSQVLLLLKTWKHVKKGDLVYVNTVLPFGAALLGKWKGCRVVYHIHETSIRPKLLKRFLFAIVRYAANEVVYVSDYLQKQERVAGVKSHLLYNSLDENFFTTAKATVKPTSETKNVLMICSLKAYKGVWEYLQLAVRHPEFKFRLVVNAHEDEIKHFFGTAKIPSNLDVFPTQMYTHRFYAWAHVVLNLSRPDQWVETFGLTMLEAMAYELPVIAPTVGGITELVVPGFNGYLCDSRNLQQVSEKLQLILTHKTHYAQLQKGARQVAGRFSPEAFQENSLKLLGISELPASVPINGKKTTPLKRTH